MLQWKPHNVITLEWKETIHNIRIITISESTHTKQASKSVDANWSHKPMDNIISDNIKQLPQYLFLSVPKKSH